jgi:gliding motility-associated protein GldL
MAPTADAMNSTKKYSEEMALAAAQMESLNSLYKVQVESSSRHAEINEKVAENSEQLQAQLESLTINLSSLNGVYGGMLSAMGGKN